MGSVLRNAFVYLTLLLVLIGSGCAILEELSARSYGPPPPIDTGSGRTGGGDGGGGGGGGGGY
jgi:hypothetical protein